MFKSADTAKTLFRMLEGCRRPTQHHLAITPMLDSASHRSGVRETTLDHIGARKAVCQALINPEPLKRQGLLQTFPQTARGHRTYPLQPPDQLEQLLLSFFDLAFGPSGAQTPNGLGLFVLGQMFDHVALFVDPTTLHYRLAAKDLLDGTAQG